MKKRKFDYSRLYYPTPKEKRGFYISANFIKVSIFVLIIGGLGYFIFLSPFFSLRNVFFEGEPTDELKLDLDNYKGKNVLLVSQENIRENLNKKYTIYKNIDIYKGLPDSIKVILYKRTRSFIWQTQSGAYSVDEDGVIYEKISSIPADNQSPIVTDNKSLPAQLGQKIVVGDFIQFVNEVSAKFNEKTKMKISQIGVEETTYHLHIKTDAGFMVMLDTMRNLDDQLEDLGLIHSKYGSDIKEYVDLRIAGRAYYK